MARKPKSEGIDAELREKILNLVRAGNHPQIAAESLGVSRRTWFRWRERGLDFSATGKSKYREFAAQLTQAVAESEAREVVTAQRASVIEKVAIQCSECGHEWNEDPARVLHITGFTEAAMRIKAMAASNSLQRLSLRFPKRWSPRVTHTIEEEHNRLLDVAQRVLAPEVFELLCEAYLAETGGDEPAGDGSVEPEPSRVH